MKEKLRAAAGIADKAEFVFQILFFVYVFLGFNNYTFGTVWISAVMWPTYALGAVLLAVRALRFKNYIRMPGVFALLALCAVCAVSILLNRQYDPKKNVIYLIFWAFYFFLLYTHGAELPTEVLQKRFRILGHLYCALTGLLTGVSLIHMAAGVSKTVPSGGVKLLRGFMHGRLYGAYLTPNAGAVAGVIACVLAVYFMRRYRSKLYTAAAAVCILMHFAYLALSDSRAGRVALALSAAAYVVFVLVALKKPVKPVLKAAVTVAAAAAVAVGLFYAPKGAQNVYNSTVRTVAARQAQEAASSDTPAKKPRARIVERGYDLSDDVSNRRFAIWQSGVEIWATRPVFGVTFAGIQPYAKEHLPDTYIVHNNYMNVETLDSDPVNLLASDGAAGVLCFAVFTVWALVFILKHALRRKEDAPLLPVLFGVCAAAASASLFASGVLFMQSPYSALFWVALGVLVRIGEDRKREALHG